MDQLAFRKEDPKGGSILVKPNAIGMACPLSPQRAMEPRPQQLPACPKLPFLQLRLPYWSRELLETKRPESKSATKEPHGSHPGG
jgi:hypothetical protein